MLMRYFLTTLMVLCCMSMAAMAQNNSDQNVDFQILDQDHTSTPIYRAPAFIPVYGHYEAIGNSIFLIFTYDIGDVTVSIENCMTGDCSSEIIPTNSGIQEFALNNDVGIYTITITTQAGIRYRAEIEL